MRFEIKRVYDEPGRSDGVRVLVDRLWPRGVSKDEAALDAWIKGLAPSDGLRKWFGHDPARFERFSKRYRAELDEADEAIDELRDAAKGRKKITLVYAAKDPDCNHARVLAGYLRKRW